METLRAVSHARRLAMGVTVLLERPKAWSGPPDTFGHDTAKPLEGETTMHAEALPPDINPESRCRLPLPNRDDLDEAGKQTFDLLSDPHGGSLAGLRGPGGLCFARKVGRGRHKGWPPIWT